MIFLPFRELVDIAVAHVCTSESNTIIAEPSPSYQSQCRIVAHKVLLGQVQSNGVTGDVESLYGQPNSRSRLLNSSQKLRWRKVTMLLDVVDNQHWSGEGNSVERYSYFAVAPSRDEPLAVRGLYVQNKMVRRTGCLRKAWAGAQFADVKPSIKLHRLGGQQLHLLDQTKGDPSLSVRMDFIEPAYSRMEAHAITKQGASCNAPT